MKPYLLVFSLLLLFSLSLEAQAVKRVNKKSKVAQQKAGKLKPGDKNWGTMDSVPLVKAPIGSRLQTSEIQSNTNGSSLPFKGSDEELQAIQSKRQLNGTPNVVDHKSDDQKLRKDINKVVDHKSDDQKLRKGTLNVVDHKSDDHKLRKGGTKNATQARRAKGPSRQNLKRGKDRI